MKTKTEQDLEKEIEDKSKELSEAVGGDPIEFYEDYDEIALLKAKLQGYQLAKKEVLKEVEKLIEQAEKK